MDRCAHLLGEQIPEWGLVILKVLLEGSSHFNCSISGNHQVDNVLGPEAAVLAFFCIALQELSLWWWDGACVCVGGSRLP